jgi:hypothetical protein
MFINNIPFKRLNINKKIINLEIFIEVIEN